MRWLIDWNLAFDPFHPPRRVYIPTPVHEEAVGGIVQFIESGQFWGSITAPTGYGKTAILDEAIARIKGPRIRAVRVDGAIDATTLYAQIAASLGRRTPPGASLAIAWRALREARALCRAMRLNVVVAIDHIQTLDDHESLHRLATLESSPLSRTSVLTCGRPEADFENSSKNHDLLDIERSGLRIRPRRLSRDETDAYLNGKLAAAGCAGPAFSPRAISRIHVHSQGIPRAIDRTAKPALVECSRRGAEIVGPAVVDAVALECDPDFDRLDTIEHLVTV